MKIPALELINRRRALAVLGGTGAALLVTSSQPPSTEAATVTCVPVTPQVTEGPYWVDEKLFRSDIRTDPDTGVARAGVPLTLTINVVNESGSTCTPLAGAYVDVWHCDAIGIYSDEPAYSPGGGTGTVVTKGQKFLRGYQITDDSGQVQFTTIYPGWYSGRTIHIHVRVRTYSGSTLLDTFTSQVFFDDTISNEVMALAPYSNRTTRRDTSNTNDMVYTGASNPSRMLATLTQSGSGYASSITIGAMMKTATAAQPSVGAGGVANAASGAAGIAPGAWTALFGTNLASAARTLAGSDVVNNALPTSLGGVSVQINGKPAFVYYISPTQVNVLSPADSSSGQVQVTVTNAAGTSAAITANLQPVLPGLFAVSNYAQAVRVSDGAVFTGVAVKPGDVLELYGTGFGPTATTVDPGLVFSGAYPTTNPVTVTIGGIVANVSFAGLVGPGLYQLNVLVPPGLAKGDQAVVASVAGLNTQAGVSVKIGNS